ncbi:MAG TPA: glycosyl transferase [Sphingobacterium sp.]|nr:glycosyl transferase [Sphingobacterium sp.]
MSKSWNVIVSKLEDFKIRKGIHSFVNPYSMSLLEENFSVANGIDYWYIDGISLVNKINKIFGKRYNRTSFDNTSVAPRVFRFAKNNKLKLGIVGTKQEYIEKAINRIENGFSVKVSYFRNGYFADEKERNDCINAIIEAEIDIVVVGMGTPYQELFLIDLSLQGWSGYGFTCGGYLHQLARKEKYYPLFFDKLNIRWLFRILDEPRLLKRYAIDYPLFFLKFRKVKKRGDVN